jgi:hypothetical protein
MMYLYNMKIDLCKVKDVWRFEVQFAVPRDDDTIDIGTLLMPFRKKMKPEDVAEQLRDLANDIVELNGYEPYMWRRTCSHCGDEKGGAYVHNCS